MNWEAIGAAGEVVGPVTVVVAPIYLAFQMKRGEKKGDVGKRRHN